MYNLIEYSKNCSKTSGGLWQYYRDESFINNDGIVIDVLDDPDSASFKYKQKTTDQTENYGSKYVQIMAPWKYSSNYWRSLEMPLINCKINIFLTWSEECIIVTKDCGDQKPEFTIRYTKHYVPAVTLSAHDNEKLLHQLKTSFKITINWNQY